MKLFYEKPLKLLYEKPLKLLYEKPLKAPSALLLVSMWLLAACQPTVQLQAPSEPITINLNVRIEHEIRVKVDQELDEVFAENDELF